MLSQKGLSVKAPPHQPALFSCERPFQLPERAVPECNNETWISSEGFSRLCVMSEAERSPITVGVIIFAQGFKEGEEEREEEGGREAKGWSGRGAALKEQAA